MNRREVLSSLPAGILGSFISWRGAQAQDTTLRGYLRTNWSHDPYSLGSYSYVAKGAEQSDRLVLGAPVGQRIYFAGEAAHPTHNSTVHAAFESGLMAAKGVAENTHQRVAVIGAGVSGLAAAQALAKTERSVTVFEARDRIGGRIWTSDALGVPLDLGASWIHSSGGNPVATLARDANTETVATDDSYIARGRHGRIIADEEEPNWLEDVTNIQHNAGADRTEINMHAYMAQPDYNGDEVIFPEGYESILPALAGAYQVQTSQYVSAIAHEQDGVTIVSNNIEHRFDAVVVTLPLGVLKAGSVTFKPALPAAKKSAIARLGMGTLDKLYLLYDTPFWDENVTWITTPENGLRPGYFNQWLNLYKYLKQPVIMAFNGGPPAFQLAEMPDEGLVSMAQQTLQGAYF